MSEAISGEARSSVATVIQGFTVAELAFHDVALAIERFRAATEQLSEASEDQAAARLALAETAQMADRVAVQVSGVVEGLRETIAVLRGIDPDRLWLQLEKLEGQQAAAATVLDAGITRADSRLVKLHDQQTAAAAVFGVRMTTVDETLEKIKVEQTAAAAAFEARRMTSDRATRRLAWLSSGALIAGFVAVALLLAIVAGLVAVR